jgi:hypothetical protein
VLLKLDLSVFFLFLDSSMPCDKYNLLEKRGLDLELSIIFLLMLVDPRPFTY